MEKKLTHSKWFLYLTEFFAGMSVMAVELGASRLMAPYFSSSQIVWTVIIGVIMVAMAVGNIWGGRMADKSKSPDRLYGRVIIAAIWIALIPFAGRWIDRRDILPAGHVRNEELSGLGGAGSLPGDLRLPLRIAGHRNAVPDQVYSGQSG